MLITPLQVDLIGINARSRQTLSVALKGPARECCVIVHTDLAEAVIVDIDGEGAADIWEEYRRAFPNRPAIVFSANPISLPHRAFLVLKPINIGELIAASARIQSLLSSQADSLHLTDESLGSYLDMELTEATTVEQDEATVACGPEFEGMASLSHSAPSSSSERTVAVDFAQLKAEHRDAQPVSPGHNEHGDELDKISALQQLYFTGSDAFIKTVRSSWHQCKEHQANRQLDFVGYGVVYFDHINERAYTNIDDTTLKDMCALSLSELDVSSTNFPVGHQLDFLASAFGDVDSSIAEALIWRLSLWTYGEKLPRNTDFNARVYLRQWPDFPHMEEIPEAMRVAAIWVSQPMSLDFTVTALNVPLSHVCTFYNAASQIGLAGIAKRDSDYLIEEQLQTAPKKTEFLGRLVGHLKKVVGSGA